MQKVTNNPLHVWRGSPFIPNANVVFDSGEELKFNCLMLSIDFEAWSMSFVVYEYDFAGMRQQHRRFKEISFDRVSVKSGGSSSTFVLDSTMLDSSHFQESSKADITIRTLESPPSRACLMLAQAGFPS
ncbi:hypothetical protein Tco_0926627 [Tanacetum coccineum]|uniref:Uncharacterized protein n=1 Tax=Tanacetum coccineum TaxID=301880 RepID=A0ABQ5DD48_9ASTR